MMAKITKKALRAQYKKYVMFDTRALMAAEELARMVSLIIGKDVDAYRCTGGELEIREDDFSLPIRIEDILGTNER